MEASEQQLYEALSKKVGFEAVTNSNSGTQLRVVGRIPNAGTGTWLQVMERLLTRAEQAPWNVDLSKQYFMRGEKLLYGWRIIFQGEGINEHLAQIAQLVASTPVTRRQLDEVPLHAGPNRNALKHGKGAQPFGSAKVGPMAVREQSG